MKPEADPKRLLAAAAAPTLAELDRAIESTEKVQYQEVLREIRRNLFEVEFEVEALLEDRQLRSNDARETLEGLLKRPPGAFVRDGRLETAARLLAKTDLSVEAIGEMVGYSTRQTFAASFEAWSRRSPSAYRRLLRSYPGSMTSSGLDMASVAFALRTLRDRLTTREHLELSKRTWRLLIAHCRQLHGAAALGLEKRLAEELWEKRLKGARNERLVELCRRFFTTSALDDLLARKGWRRG